MAAVSAAMEACTDPDDVIREQSTRSAPKDIICASAGASSQQSGVAFT